MVGQSNTVLVEVDVQQKYRKHKIGSRLLNEVIDFAKQEKCENSAGSFHDGTLMRLNFIKKWAL